MQFSFVALWLFTWLGHAALWVGVANRLHALALSRALNKGGSYFCHACLVFLPLVIGWYEYHGGPPAKAPVIAAENQEPSISSQRPSDDGSAVSNKQVSHTEDDSVPSRNPMFWRTEPLPVLYYCVCWITAVIFFPQWIVWRITARTTKLQLSNTTTEVNVAHKLGYKPGLNRFGKFMSSLPGNQVFRLAVQEKELLLPNLPPALDGLTIAHVSDFHLKGRIDKPFFVEAIRATNELGCDLIAVTGDLFDKPEFLEWIPDTFAQLRAKLGVYYILGNHDMRYGFHDRIQAQLDSAGWHYLGQMPHTLEVRGQKIYLAGNELPWLPLSPKLEAIPRARTAATPEQRPFAQHTSEKPRKGASAEEAPPKSGFHTFRLLLSHSPDQFRWAQQHRFDLMLAGHTHGGQIRLPLIGAVYAPSLYGVKYAGGTFFKAPTLMHVTRGVGGEMPLRFNCRPEISKLVLRSPYEI